MDRTARPDAAEALPGPAPLEYSESMDLKRLTYFCTIVEQGQISRAAKILNMSQPPLSQRLKELEDDLGVQLISREGHTWQVTEAGRVLYERSRLLLDQLGDLASEVQNAADGASGNLRIGASSTCVTRFLKVLPGLRRRFPRLTYSLLISDSTNLGESVLSREVDFALLLLPVTVEGCTVHPLPSDNFSVVMAPELDRPGLPPCLGVEHLEGMPLVCLRRWTGGGTYELLLKAFQQHGIKPDIVLDTPDTRTVVACLYQGLAAAAILPASEVPYGITDRFPVHALDLPGMAMHPALVHLSDRYLTGTAREVIAAILAG
jgi:DNA-binding transcriptional LysR family regulator